MEIAHSPSGSRFVRLALIGAGLAFAWFVLSIALGFASSDARADDATDDSRGAALLSGVTTVLDRTTSAVTSTVSSAVPAVTDAVKSVLSAVPAPAARQPAPQQPPPQQPAPAPQQPAPAPQQPAPAPHEPGPGIVSPVVQIVAAPVVDVVDSGLVSQLTAPVVATLGRVPVVADVVARLGLDAAVTDTAAIIDRTASEALHLVADVGAAVDGVLPAIPGVIVAEPPAPDSAAAPPPADVTDAAASVSPSPALARTARSVVFDGPGASTPPPGSPSSAAPSDGPSIPGAVPSSAPLTSTAGPGGTGSAAWALVAAVPFAAHRAWVRRAGPANDVAPGAPLFATDVSPD
ncbi:hypothetical protein [Microbacterium immunditiarum]|uniref:Biotin carboxyl carrier protein n=1 Tax=Microbacterium immunditiarum TaxID=337480 RepID=A0A7Y9GL36_9MICO|nr:hypothetical protein [Microbacterium immunditiarum]NYE18497.1 biotin carboxyl carrier protein [Microbacterium immunditiarum]